MNKKQIAVIAIIALVTLQYASLFSLWMIDISFGALSSGGCVTQGSNCVSPMLFYHHYLRILTATLFTTYAMLGVLLAYIFLRV